MSGLQWEETWMDMYFQAYVQDVSDQFLQSD